MSVRRRILIAALLLLLAIAGVAAWIVWPRSITPVSEDQAVEEFREQTTGTADEGPAIPEAGVYAYSGTGDERIGIGPLPTQVRPIPATVTGIVVASADRCFTLTVNYFAQHTEDTRYCVTDDGALRIDEQIKHQEVSSFTMTSTMTCNPAILLPNRPGDVPLACDLTLTGAPVDISMHLVGGARRGRDRSIRIGGRPVTVAPVTMTLEITGSLTGRWVETTWFTPQHLPARIDRDFTLTGPATFSERSTLVLRGLTPTT